MMSTSTVREQESKDLTMFNRKGNHPLSYRTNSSSTLIIPKGSMWAPVVCTVTTTGR